MMKIKTAIDLPTADSVRSIPPTPQPFGRPSPGTSFRGFKGGCTRTRGRGEVLGQAGVAKTNAYHLNRSIKESKK